MFSIAMISMLFGLMASYPVSNLEGQQAMEPVLWIACCWSHNVSYGDKVEGECHVRCLNGGR